MSGLNGEAGTVADAEDDACGDNAGSESAMEGPTGRDGGGVEGGALLTGFSKPRVSKRLVLPET